MGDLIQFPAHRARPDPLLTKKQVATALGYSPRWIEMRMSEGMPHNHSANGRAQFRLEDCRGWIERERGRDEGTG